MKNTRAYIAAFLLLAGGIGYLCYAGITESGIYFLNVAEARAADTARLRQARLFGVVSEKNLQKSLNALAFELRDKDNPAIAIPVQYQGPAPDAFKPGAEVIVEGGMGDGGCFNAKTLMTKCPSKYRNRV